VSGSTNIAESRLVGVRDGTNEFLATLEPTDRRDERTGRPRINKAGSQLDREQKNAGEYCYSD